MKTVFLVNTNVVRPPVSPVGLEYVAEALVEAGVVVKVLDLAFEPDWRACLQKELGRDEPLAVGLSVRNTDDCSFTSRKSFLPWIGDVVAEVRKATEAPVFLGGVGFSTSPEAVLSFAQADCGIAGDGEDAALALVDCQRRGQDFRHLANLVYRRDGGVVSNPRAEVDLRYLPPPRRRSFDNRRYEQSGAMVGVETKRGCAQRCIFCADPVAKGTKVRLRPPERVVQEVQDLVEQGVSWFHLCDSEFNLPPVHARAICQALIEKGLGERIRWYGYCSPVPFDCELVALMKAAGCAGINFGVDSLCDAQLRRLHRRHTLEDLRQLVNILRGAGLNYIFDLLVGGPGETAKTLNMTINNARELNVPLVGIAAGVRVYPGTPLAKAISDGRFRDGLHPGMDDCPPDQPLFYLSPALGGDAMALVNRLAGDDPRFLLLSSPAEKGSYNYAGDEALSQLIAQGARGAYWDILRQQRGI